MTEKLREYKGASVNKTKNDAVSDISVHTTSCAELKLDIFIPEQTIVIQNEPSNKCTKYVFKVQQLLYKVLQRRKAHFLAIFGVICLLLYSAYFAYAMYFRFGDEGSIRLLLCTICGILISLSIICLDSTKKKRIKFRVDTVEPFMDLKSTKRSLRICHWILRLSVFVFLVVYTIVDIAIEHPRNLLCIVGIAIYLVLLYIFSVSPAKVKWHTVFWGLALQYLLAIVILRQEWGYSIFKWTGDRVSELLSYSDAGSVFLFGKDYKEHFFAFSILPTFVFFCTVINILYYMGIMQVIVRFFGRFLAFCTETTVGEALSAAANIFLDMTEVYLLISPLMDNMTNSELHAVVTCGFATLAGSVIRALVDMGISANHLVAASVMSAPAALAISKLAYPETKVSNSTSKDFYRMKISNERNVIEAVSNGATSSIKIVAAIAVNTLAFLSLLKFINATLTWFGDRAGVEGLTLELICSYILFPVPYFMGVDVNDCGKVAELIGIKTLTNEFIAYGDLATIIHNGNVLKEYMSTTNGTGTWFREKGNIVLNSTGTFLPGGVLQAKSEVIATYALCGFANFGSLGVALGALGAIIPARKTDLSRLILRAMISGTVTCFMSASIAGLLYKE